MDKVLVGYIYTKYKEYCRWMFPKTFDSLTYKNKYAYMVDEDHFPILKEQPTGEQVCSMGRQLITEKAREIDVDWILYLDLDLEPDPDTIQKLLAVKHPIVGGLVSARGNAWQIIGHNYKNRKTLERKWLTQTDVKDNKEVDGISGACLLVARGIYSKYDYKDYNGPDTIKGRYTADDEYLQIKVYEGMKIKPRVASNCYSWHYDSNGRAYKLFGEQKIWRAY